MLEMVEQASIEVVHKVRGTGCFTHSDMYVASVVFGSIVFVNWFDMSFVSTWNNLSSILISV